MSSNDRHRTEDELLTAIERRAAFLWLRRRAVAMTAVVVVTLGAGVPVLADRMGERAETVEAALPAETTTSRPGPAEEPHDDEVAAAPTTLPPTPPTTLPSAPPTTALPPAGGVGAGAGASNLAITVEISDTTPNTGDVVTLTITVADPDADQVGYGVDYGDGIAGDPFGDDPPCGGGDPGGTPEAGRTEVFTDEHVYVAPGTFRLVVTGVSSGCDVEDERDTVEFDLVVGGDALTKWEKSGDGIALEVYSVDSTPAEDEAVRYVARWQVDVGTVVTFSWDPGDDSGGAYTWSAGLACEEGQTAPDPATTGDEHWEHAYPEAGTFTSRVAVESAACVGPSAEVEVAFDVTVLL